MPVTAYWIRQPQEPHRTRDSLFRNGADVKRTIRDQRGGTGLLD
jgi:hypothetical protein